MGESRDLRAYARSTQFRLAVGAIVLLFLVGDGLVWCIYGPRAAVLALLCTVMGLMPVGLILLWLWGMDRIVRRARDE